MYRRERPKQVPLLKNMNYTERLKQSKCQHWNKEDLGMLWFKIADENYDKEVTSGVLDFNETSITGGNSKKSTKRSSKLNIRKNTFKHRMTDTWNSLPEKSITAENVRQFEKRLDNYWKHQGCIDDLNVGINNRKPGCGFESYTRENT